ncbi:Hint domain-containing protein [Plastoroseomonas arctica]|uniref:Hint domain-containing protein n=1 Tax=Plastoroseomonas arctica TaxID=1509237 RepID=A0AAF1KKG9_9PROT|nr:Hint domain-containing protein [Plastoroseomonas arctica]MBR0655289.1 Hint domain-containing protein [Plastoroseomonas arctica]
MSWTSDPDGGHTPFNRDDAGHAADGHAGDDTLHGAGGNDTIAWSGAAGDTISDGGAPSDTLDLGALFGGSAWTTGTDGSGAATYSYNPDGAAAEAALFARSAETVLCYAAGTRIATPRGEVPIEALRVGELVLCADRGVQPILWIGRIEAQLAGHPHPERAWPVLIRAGALGAGLPRRDLRVSPDHGIYLEGALVPAKLLVNGASIIQERWWAAITYLHLELPEHAILLAEGLPAESWLDDGRRDAFDNAGLAAQFVDFGLELSAERPPGNFPVILDPAEAARIRDRVAPRACVPLGLTWTARGATKLAEDTEEARHAPPPVRWRQRRHPDRAEA